jgi:hypothetical protein
MLVVGERFTEAAMTNGLILLGFLAILVAFAATRVRRRMGMNVTGKTWAVIMAGFILIMLAVWVGSTQG